MVHWLPSLVGFAVSWVVSAVTIYVITRLFGEKEGVVTAFLTALVGAAIYSLVFLFLGIGAIAAVVGGIGWLLALGFIYKIGWVKAFIIAVVVWFVATVIGYFLPTLAGPLSLVL